MALFTIEIAGVSRQLPVISVNDQLQVATLNILGDRELVEACAQALVEKVARPDIIVTAETKGIPLAAELARLYNMPRFVVARKENKPYMQTNLQREADGLTYVLDGKDAELLKGKHVLVVDDFVGTGQAIQLLDQLVRDAGAETTTKASIAVQGSSVQYDDITYLVHIPLIRS